MSILFGRSASLTVGVPGEQGKKFTDLRITFDIEKSIEANPNSGKISIFNLSEQSRALFEQKGATVILMAGYTIPELIFSGDVKKPLNNRSGPDWITEIEAGDGETAYQEARIDKSYTPGTSVRQIVTDLGKQLGTSVGEIKGVTAETFVQGFVASGPVRKYLDEMTEKQGLKWSIQDNALQILPKGDSTTEEAVVLSADSGLVGNPKKKDKGIEFQCLLQPKLKPGRKVIIISKTVNGTYTVQKVRHNGDTEGGEWYSNCEAV